MQAYAIIGHMCTKRFQSITMLQFLVLATALTADKFACTVWCLTQQEIVKVKSYIY